MVKFDTITMSEIIGTKGVTLCQKLDRQEFRETYLILA